MGYWYSTVFFHHPSILAIFLLIRTLPHIGSRIHLDFGKNSQNQVERLSYPRAVMFLISFLQIFDLAHYIVTLEFIIERSKRICGLLNAPRFTNESINRLSELTTSTMVILGHSFYEARADKVSLCMCGSGANEMMKERHAEAKKRSHEAITFVWAYRRPLSPPKTW